MANNFQRPIIAQGNDFYINIILTKLNEGDIENLDLTHCKSVEVYLICGVHNTRIDLDYTIPQSEHNNVINAFVDHRMLHNTSYGICVEGLYDNDMHWRWYCLPKEGILVVPNTSGQNIPVEIEYIDVHGRVGFGEIDLSDYYTKEETNTILESYATETELQNYQETLISGENIKTINNQSILGEGNITIEAAEQQQANWNETDDTAPSYIQNKPDLSIYAQSSNLATVATSGDYNDLQNKPDLSNYATQSDLSNYVQLSDLSTVATSGDYNDLQNKPDLSNYATQSDLQNYQETLISGTNIKTINNQSILGAGNIDIQGGGGTQVQANWTETDTSSAAYIQNKPDLSIYAQSSNLATVATSGDYNDLTNTPTIPAAQVQANWNESDTTSKAYIQNKPDLSIYVQSSNLAPVATSGDYNDLLNLPNIETPGFYQLINGNNTGLVNILTTNFNGNIGSHAVIEGEGANSTNLIEASGGSSHAEGRSTKATGHNSHAEGEYAQATGRASHAEGYYTQANNWGSHAEGSYTSTLNNFEHAEGQSNISSKANNTFGDAGNTLSSIGNGDTVAHNAFEVRQNGDIYYADTEKIDGSTVYYYTAPLRKLQDAMVTSTTAGVKIEVVNALPASPDSNTLYIVI